MSDSDSDREKKESKEIGFFYNFFFFFKFLQIIVSTKKQIGQSHQGAKDRITSTAASL